MSNEKHDEDKKKKDDDHEKDHINIVIDDKKYRAPKEVMTGTELRHLAQPPKKRKNKRENQSGIQELASVARAFGCGEGEQAGAREDSFASPGHTRHVPALGAVTPRCCRASHRQLELRRRLRQGPRWPRCQQPHARQHLLRGAPRGDDGQHLALAPALASPDVDAEGALQQGGPVEPRAPRWRALSSGRRAQHRPLRLGGLLLRLHD